MPPCTARRGQSSRGPCQTRRTDRPRPSGSENPPPEPPTLGSKVRRFAAKWQRSASKKLRGRMNGDRSGSSFPSELF